MKRIIPFVLTIFLLACQPQAVANNLYFVDGEKIIPITRAEGQTPATIAAQSGNAARPEDRFLLDGREIPADIALPGGGNITLQIRRAAPVTLVRPGAQESRLSAAASVAEALVEAGISLRAGDFISPPAHSPLRAGQVVTYRPARGITIQADGQARRGFTSALTVGEALAEAGMPLNGLDASFPAESDALPDDGVIKIVRVGETIEIKQESIPFSAQFVASAEVDLDVQTILQVGEPGLKVRRERVRFEDGREVSRVGEAETLVRPPQDQVTGYGTRVTVRTLPGGIEYWRAVRMYATWYSPCNSGISGCSYGTSSGLPVKKGVVAFKLSWYRQMAGQQVYVPGYGVATVADVGGGMPDGRPWIDLGYSDSDSDHLSGWVTVYFLTPVPASFPYILE